MKKKFLSVLLSLFLILSPLVVLTIAKPTFSGGGSHSSSSGGGSTSHVSTPPPSRPTPSPTKTQAKAGYDDAAQVAMKHQQSKKAYDEVVNRPSTAYKPRPTYTDSKGNVRPVDANSPSVRVIRNNYSYTVYQTRTPRMTSFYGPRYSYYYSRPAIYYNDPINSIFWYWLMDQSIRDQTLWVYNHRSEIDDARYNQLLAQNAQLQSQINILQQHNAPRDPTYCPKGMDPDLQYNDQYVRAAANIDDQQADINNAQTVVYSTGRDYDNYQQSIPPTNSGPSISVAHVLWELIKWAFILLFSGIILWAIIATVIHQSQSKD